MKFISNLQIIIPGQTKYLNLISKVANILVNGFYFPKAVKITISNNLKTVLTEAIVNSIKHGCNSTTNCSVRVFITASHKELVINVYDSGHGFNLNSIPNINMDSNLLEESGRGIQIIKQLMDSVDYKKLYSGNVLVMKTKFKVI